MLAKVLGTRDLDFKATDGNEIKGEMVDKVFVKHDSPLASVSYKFGSEYDFVYEIHGFRSKPQLVDIKKDGKSLVSSVGGIF